VIAARRLHNVSKIRHGAVTIQQPNGGLDRRRTPVHVPLRRGEIAVARQLLNRRYGRAPHRQMRTERVPQNVRPRVRRFAARGQARLPCGAFD